MRTITNESQKQNVLKNAARIAVAGTVALVMTTTTDIEKANAWGRRVWFGGPAVIIAPPLIAPYAYPYGYPYTYPYYPYPYAYVPAMPPVYAPAPPVYSQPQQMYTPPPSGVTSPTPLVQKTPLSSPTKHVEKKKVEKLEQIEIPEGCKPDNITNKNGDVIAVEVNCPPGKGKSNLYILRKDDP